MEGTIKNYFSKRGHVFFANDFINYYQQKGWKKNKHWRKMAKKWIRSNIRLLRKNSQNIPFLQVVGGVAGSVEHPQVGVPYDTPKNQAGEPNKNVENTTAKDYLSKYDYTKIFKEKLLSPEYQSWLEIVGMQLRIPMQALEKAIDDFILSLKFEDNKVHTDFHDFKNHFKNWVRLKKAEKQRLEYQSKIGRL